MRAEELQQSQISVWRVPGAEVLTCLNIFPQDQSEQGTDRFSRSKKGSALRRVQAGTLRLQETSQPHRVTPEVEASILESETKSVRDRVLVEQKSGQRTPFGVAFAS